VASLVLVIVLLALDIVHAKNPYPISDPNSYQPNYLLFGCLASCLIFLYRIWTPLINHEKKEKPLAGRRAPDLRNSGEHIHLDDFLYDLELSMKNQIKTIVNNDNSIDDMTCYVDPDPLDCYVKKITSTRLKTPDFEQKARILQSDLNGFFNEKKRSQKERLGFEKRTKTLSSLTEDEFLQLSRTTSRTTKTPELSLEGCEKILRSTSDSNMGLTIITEDPNTKPTVFNIVAEETEEDNEK